MTPIMGVGINYAIQDAIATANILGPVLASGKQVGLEQLAKVQQRRQRPVAIMQFVQARVQSGLGIPELDEAGNIINLGGMANSPIQKVPLLGQLGLRLIATGFRPETVQPA
ncbi:MAG: FAD-dependent oxidoreductase, partial [Chloroflexota bacterium]